MSRITAFIGIVVVLLVLSTIVTAIVYAPEPTQDIVPYVIPVLAIGLAVALQKYIASFFASFIITFTGIYGLDDRIRIGSIKGDVRRIGLIHTTPEEVGEDEKLGGELTGRIVHVPNLVVLDQPVLNYTKAHSIHDKAISSDYMFDEVRIPITNNSNAERACQLLESLLRINDEACIREAERVFKTRYPKFLDEARAGPRVLVHIEPQRIWIKGKFVAPIRGRNDLRSKILLHFFNEVATRSDIHLA
jgi:small-conductance mechanosensitive channel